MYSVILGHLGTDAVAANSLVTVVRNIGSVFCFAIASAGTILLGRRYGKRRSGEIKNICVQNAEDDSYCRSSWRRDRTGCYTVCH